MQECFLINTKLDFIPFYLAFYKTFGSIQDGRNINAMLTGKNGKYSN